MAAESSSRPKCPVCGAQGAAGIGSEGTRSRATYARPSDENPEVVRRRKRARAIRAQNEAGGK